MARENKDSIYLKTGDTHTICLKHAITRPDIIVGDYTIYTDPIHDPRDFENTNVLFFPMRDEKLIIGKYCLLAYGTRFMRSSGCHALEPLSLYPFGYFKEGWDDSLDVDRSWDYKGDIVVGNDVWFGYDSFVMPGVKIGDGAIIGARSVVTKDVDPYVVVGGAPARPIRKRFDDRTIALLMEMKWWDWEYEVLRDALPLLLKPDIDGLYRYYQTHVLK